MERVLPYMTATQEDMMHYLTPAKPHCRHGMPFEIAYVQWNEALAARPGGFGFPGSPARDGYHTVGATSVTHPQTVGTLHMTPEGWEPLRA